MKRFNAPTHKLMGYSIFCTGRPYNNTLWTTTDHRFVQCKHCLKKLKRKKFPIHKIIITGIGKAHILCDGRDYISVSDDMRTDIHDNVIECLKCLNKLKVGSKA